MKSGIFSAFILCLFLIQGQSQLFAQEKGKKRNPDRISVSTARDPERKAQENGDEDTSYVSLDFEPDTTDNRTVFQKLFGYRTDDEDRINPYTNLVVRAGTCLVWWNDDQYKEINPVDLVCARFSLGWLDPLDFDFLPQRLHYTIDADYIKSVRDSTSMTWDATYDNYYNISMSGFGGGTSVLYDLSRSIYGRVGFGVTRWTKDTMITRKDTSNNIMKFPTAQKLYVIYYDFNLGYRQFITKSLFIGAEGGASITPSYAYPSISIMVTCGYAL